MTKMNCSLILQSSSTNNEENCLYKDVKNSTLLVFSYLELLFKNIKILRNKKIRVTAVSTLAFLIKIISYDKNYSCKFDLQFKSNFFYRLS